MVRYVPLRVFFKSFDPLTGVVPKTCPNALGEVLIRARKLLNNRSSAQIGYAAEGVYGMICDYFEALKNKLQALNPGTKEEDLMAQSSDGRGMVNYRESVTELTALKDSIGGHLLEDDNFQNAHEYEYFAAYALWEVSEAISFRFLESTYSSRYVEQDSLSEVSEAKLLSKWCANSSTCAMDAVSWAEHLKSVDEAVQHGSQRLLSKKNRNSAVKGHRRNHAIKLKAISYYRDNFDELGKISMDAAAQLMLDRKIVPRAFRTVRDWIGEYHKELRSACKP